METLVALLCALGMSIREETVILDEGVDVAMLSFHWLYPNSIGCKSKFHIGNTRISLG